MLEIPDVFFGAMLAFAATAAGAAGLFLIKKLGRREHLAIIAFSSGVMLFSAGEMLLQAYALLGLWRVIGSFLLGGAVLFAMERLIPHAHAFVKGKKAPGMSEEGKKALLVGGTITLHNIPEGFAIAAAFAASSPLGWLVSVSMAVQDFPEGLIVSAPLAAYGISKKQSVFWGVFSGAVEAGAAIVGFFLIAATTTLTPVALAFSAGAMAFVTLFELLPDAFSCKDRRLPIIALALGLAAACAIAALLAVRQ